MIEPKSVTEFLHIVVRSGVVPQAELDAHVGRYVTSGRMPDSASAIAELFVRDGFLTAFQARLFLRGLWRRFVLCGKYRVLRPIGTGGMGVVYLCEHLVMKRPVAVKVLPPSVSDPSSPA